MTDGAACTCANPAQWLEVACPVHGPEAQRILAAQAETPATPLQDEPSPEPPAPEKPKRPPPPRLPGAIERRVEPHRANLKTPVARWIATLDAQGLNGQEICKAVGLSHASVSRYRNSEGYPELLTEMSNAMTQRLEPMIQRALAISLEGYVKGVERLMELVDATDSEGNPQHGIRTSAAKALVNDLAMLKRVVGVSDPDNRQQGAGATVIVNIDKQHGLQIIEQPPLEGEAEDATWTPVEGGGGAADQGDADADVPEYTPPEEPPENEAGF